MKDSGDPNGIRTRVTAVKGRCPRPLDDRVRKAGAISEAHPCVASYLPQSGSTLQSVAVERSLELLDAGEVAGVETKEGREHSLFQVEIEMRGEERQ